MITRAMRLRALRRAAESWGYAGLWGHADGRWVLWAVREGASL